MDQQIDKKPTSALKQINVAEGDGFFKEGLDFDGGLACLGYRVVSPCTEALSVIDAILGMSQGVPSMNVVARAIVQDCACCVRRSWRWVARWSKGVKARGECKRKNVD